MGFVGIQLQMTCEDLLQTNTSYLYIHFLQLKCNTYTLEVYQS